MLDVKIKTELQKKYGTEQVYAVPYQKVKNIPDKFSVNITCGLKDWDNYGVFIRRSDAEYNFAMQQLIPYVVIKNSDGSKYYVSRRITGDKRLQGKWSFFGGHIAPIDYVISESVILNAAKRELSEEVNIKFKKNTDFDFLGTVRDLTSDTNEHLGFVFLVTAVHASINEKEKLAGRWMTLHELFTEYNEFESWAKYIIDYLYETSHDVNMKVS